MCIHLFRVLCIVLAYVYLYGNCIIIPDRFSRLSPYLEWRLVSVTVSIFREYQYLWFRGEWSEIRQVLST